MHSSSASSDLIKSDKNVVETRRTIEISRAYFPNAIADKLSIKARANCTINTLGIARRALTKGDAVTAIVQVREALKCSFSLRVIGVLTLLAIGRGINRVKQYVNK